LNNIPYVLSLYFTDELKLLSGEDLFDIVEYVQLYNPLAIGFNCILPETFLKIVNKIPINLIWGFYLNCGSGNYSDKIIECSVNEYAYLEYVKNILPFNPSFIGSCCGSNPNHTKIIKTYLDELPGNKSTC